jgi:tryptophan synthase beta chain
MEARAYTQNAVFEAATTFARTQGIVPAPEPSHAIRAVIDEAIVARETGEEKVILFNLCGHGFLDMQAYDDYNNGRLMDFEFDQAEEDRALAAIPDVPIPG